MVWFIKVNQIGIFGFGGDKCNSYQLMFEGLVVYLFSCSLVIGVEYWQKLNNLSIVKEDNWVDFFVVWVLIKYVLLMVVYVDFGNIVIKDKQCGFYVLVQVGF